MQIDFNELKKEDCRTVARRLGMEINRQDKARCFLHVGDKNPSLQVYADGWKCFGCGEHGDAVDLVARYRGISNIEAAEWMKQEFDIQGPPKKQDYGQVEREHIYPGGQIKKAVYRRADGSKYACWFHMEGGAWEKGRGKSAPLLYPSSDNLATHIFLVEGEKDVDTWGRMGKSAVSLPDGANSKWSAEYTPLFSGKHVYIIQDNDTPGKEYAQRLAAALKPIAAEVKILDLTKVWPELPEKGDTTDLIEYMGDKAGTLAILSLAQNEEVWEPGAYSSSTMKNQEARNGRAYNEEHRLTLEATRQALDDLGISVRYNQLLKITEVTGLPEVYSKENAANVLPAYLMDYLRSCKYKGVSRQAIDDYLVCISDWNRYNPVKEYLLKDTWDKISRFPEVYRILGVTNPKYKTYIRKWFIQCVALALNDEQKPVGADGILVLQGEQGLAKTSFFRIMSPFPQWFVEGAVLDVNSKDSVMTALSGWITELGELDSTLKKEQSSIKAFVTRAQDKIRYPYARTDTISPRRTSFCGTVNPADYLKDDTGNRRYWTIHITNIDKKALFSLDRHFVAQLWRETYQMYLADKEGFRLTDEEMRELQADNREFEQRLQYELEISALLDYNMPVSQWEWWSAAEFAEIINADARKVGKALAKIIEDNPPGANTKDQRFLHGTPQYLLPKHHVTAQIFNFGHGR